MGKGKRDYIDDCARLIERRVELLEEELAGPFGQSQMGISKACDRAAIMEAKHLAKLIRSLDRGPYVSHPHDVACGRTGWGPKVR